ncbi:MAG: alpha-L-fucosidase [Verrucomicrobia bacterium]|nr:alpha-L-fucosidase [Verrucomicrobiota bacterium]
MGFDPDQVCVDLHQSRTNRLPIKWGGMRTSIFRGIGRDCLIAFLLTLLPLLAFVRADTRPGATEKELQWWRDAKFGLFIHWGPVSLKGTEIGWSRGAQVPVEEYDGLFRRFNPAQFDATAWSRTAKAAGMKYVVLTSKHHDGFCLWDTQFTDYNIMRTPWGRDVMKELAAACRKQRLVFGIYHSICDWHHPDYPLGSPGGKSPKPAPNMDRYNQYLKNQLAELLRNYQPLGILWFDGEWETPWTAERGLDLYQYVRAFQPGILINNRVGKGRAGMEGSTAAGDFAGDFDTPEQGIGKFRNDRPWESCITIGQQWSWKPNDKLKSLKECIDMLVRTVGGDGNLLLNVGPMPNGEIEKRQAERLQQIGGWLKENGKSIYATRGGPFLPGEWGASTHRGKTIYVHLLKENEDERIRLPGLETKVVRARILNGPRLAWQQSSGSIEVQLPRRLRRENDTILVLSLDGPAEDLAPRPVGW